MVCPCHLSRFSRRRRGHAARRRVSETSTSIRRQAEPGRADADRDLSGSARRLPRRCRAAPYLHGPAAASAGEDGRQRHRARRRRAVPSVVLRASASQMLALDARCPHLGCAVERRAGAAHLPVPRIALRPRRRVKLGPAEQALTASCGDLRRHARWWCRVPARARCSACSRRRASPSIRAALLGGVVGAAARLPRPPHPDAGRLAKRRAGAGGPLRSGLSADRTAIGRR